MRERRVRKDPGRVLTAGNPRKEIADESGRLQKALGDETEDERQRKGDDERRNERKTVFHTCAERPAGARAKGRKVTKGDGEQAA